LTYVQRQLKALSDPRLQVYRGTASHVCVQHDLWCAKLKGTGTCTCDPDMLMMMSDGTRFEITRDGTLVTPRPRLFCRCGFDPHYNRHFVN
jgi:hypothetical protein